MADVGHPAYPWLEGEVELVRQALAQPPPLGAQVARQGERLIANLLDLLTADLVGR